MFGSLGLAEIGIIAAVAILLFGPRQLPKMGRAIGETIAEMRKVGKEVSGVVDDINTDLKS